VSRVGIGYDVHPFEPGRRLVLGGVAFEDETGLAGHSDGDVLIHAVIDALLGAAGLGDIGQHFPSTDERWRGGDSLEMLKHVASLVAKAGFIVANVDATVVAERPRIASRSTEMRHRLAHALDADASAIGIKATTTDGLGALGRGEGIAAMAVALLEYTPG
jgi:2-C-methyl-D-erythritol 2,4-cyclodiphosphate synthase